MPLTLVFQPVHGWEDAGRGIIPQETPTDREPLDPLVRITSTPTAPERMGSGWPKSVGRTVGWRLDFEESERAGASGASA